MFVYSVRKQIAAMAAVLEGLELLVFTGGIGENDARTRAEICAGLSWLGFDPVSAQESGGAQPRGDRPRIRVLPANEEEQIARHALALIVGSHPSAT
jgi:acetate kinase